MRNNIQNDVKIEAAENHYTKKNLSGSISNTHQLGRVGVCFSRPMLADSKAMCSPETLIQTTPLVSPCYAKQHYKQWHMFIPIEDVYKNYSALMTGKEISRNGTIISPTHFPHITSRELAEYCLQGAKCTLWFKLAHPDGRDDKPEGEFFSAGALNRAVSIPAEYLVGGGSSASAQVQAFVNSAVQQLLWGPDAEGVPKFNLSQMFSHSGYVVDFVSGNLVDKNFIIPDASEDASATDEMGYDYNSYVAIDSADVTFFKKCRVEITSNLYFDFWCAYCFRLSTWGAELYKLIRGLGYSFDFDDDSLVSILPLIATYKAYWDIFGLNLWQNYESTYAGRLQTYYDNMASLAVRGDTTANELFGHFIFDELGQMWLTEKNDYISAHLPQPVIGNANETPLFGLADVLEGTGESGPERVINAFDRNYSDPGQPDITLKDGHARISKIQHGALDSEILKRMYKATNIQTALGQKIVALMKANGLGTYMERTRVNFIGEFNVDLDVNGVTATSDTYNSASGDGRPLGSRAGKCVGYNKPNKKMFYKTDCFGWWIALDCVTCDSGWSQGVDLTNKAIKQTQMYQPRYDALGMKIDCADVLVGTRDVCLEKFPATAVGSVLSPAKKPWGYAPRFSEFKVGRSLDNGGFALKSRRAYFLTYDMNKLIFIDDMKSFGETDSSGLKKMRFARSLSIDNLPIAGNPYRFLNRWPWLANLGRIFANMGRTLPSFMFEGNILSFLSKAWQYVFLDDDNYIIQTDVWFKAWNTAVPIEACYGTVDPEEKELKFIERV